MRSPARPRRRSPPSAGIAGWRPDSWLKLRVRRRHRQSESIARQDGAARVALYKLQETRSLGLLGSGVHQYRGLLERRMIVAGHNPPLAALHGFRKRQRKRDHTDLCASRLRKLRRLRNVLPENKLGF